MGVACALAAREVVWVGAALSLLVLLLGAGLERGVARLLGAAGNKFEDAPSTAPADVEGARSRRARTT